MSTILDTIIADRRRVVRVLKKQKNISTLCTAIDITRKPNSLKQALTTTGASGIIAEFKRQSPSKGIINADGKPEVITKGYANAGASGLSILTEPLHFGGSDEDLKQARTANPSTPILRKDFIIDPYQIVEAAALQADVILLIAAILSTEEIRSFTTLAHEYNLEVLLELHSSNELEKIDDRVDIIGINNRNLKTFEVAINHSLNMLKYLPTNTIKIAESGLNKPDSVAYLRQGGMQGFLIGETFMKETDPALACKNFINALKY